MTVTAIILIELRTQVDLATAICVGGCTADERNGTGEDVLADKRTTAGCEKRSGRSRI